MTEPFAVLCTDDSTWQERVAWLRSRGWTIVQDDELPADPFDLRDRRIAWCGPVASPEEQERALTAGLRGAAVVVLLRMADPVTAESFAEHLAAVAPGSPPTSDAALPPATAPLDADTVRLLTRLSQGWTIADAARDGLMSLRTANRKLAAARTRYGASSTTAAVIGHLRELGGGVPGEHPGSG